MTFSERLNRYLETLDCPANHLSKVTGIPPYTISKYRSGSRLPERESATVASLAKGIRAIAEEKGVQSILDSDVAAALNDAILSEVEAFDFETLIRNLRLIVKGYGVTLTEIAEKTNYNRSTLYSMWSGKSKLRDPDVFVDSLAQYIVSRFGDMNGQMKATALIGWPEPLFDFKENYLEAMKSWLSGDYVSEAGLTEKDLQNVNAFDLNEYQRITKHDTPVLSKIPIRLAKVNEYYGLKGMENAVADFLKATFMSRSYKDVILYNDFPVTNLLLEETSPQLWSEGMAMALQKGITVKSVHYMDRPLDDILAGMNVWIPMFMSGQFKPLYVEHKKNLFHNCILASGACVLRGNCVENDYDDAYFQLFTAQEAVEREYRSAEHLVSKAKPLMESYTAADKELFEQILQSYLKTPGSREEILSAPPVYTISNSLLSRILDRNRVSDKDARKIRAHIRKERKWREETTAENEIYVRLTHFTKDECETYPVRLNLSRGLLDFELFYSYDEYEQHIDETRLFAGSQKNFHFFVDNKGSFRNIQITIIKGLGAMISKSKSPETHLVLKHPRWISALTQSSVGEGRSDRGK